MPRTATTHDQEGQPAVSDVPDEAAHLAGALLLAGFSHVVATHRYAATGWI